MDYKEINSIGFRKDRHPNVLAAVNDYAKAKRAKYPANAIEDFLTQELPRATKKILKQNSIAQSAQLTD